MVGARASWDAVAHGWDRESRWYARSVRPLTDWFCDAVAMPGAHVFDVACGTGQPALAIAGRVGRHGRVVATDFSPAMVEATRRRASEAGLHNVDTLVMDASDLECADQVFDAVTCACGLMFCADPKRVAREMYRVLVPGGRVAIAVWGQPDDNSFFTVAANAIGSVAPLPRFDPPAAGPFRLATPGELERLLASAGFADIVVEPLPMTFELASVDAYFRVFTHCAVGVADHVASFDASELATVRAALHEGSRAFAHGDRLRLSGMALCASGRAPGSPPRRAATVR